MSDLRTDDLRDVAAGCRIQATAARKRAPRSMTARLHDETSEWLLNAADEIDRLRELVDVLKSVPGASIVLSKDEYDALTAAIESPPEPTPALRKLMAEGE